MTLKICAGPKDLVEGRLEFLPNCRPDGPWIIF